MSSNITDLATRMATTQESRNFMALLAAGPDMRKYLADALPTLTHDEQRVMIAAAVWRFMGGMLPLSPELFKRLPTVRKLALDQDKLEDVLGSMVDKGLLVIADIEHSNEDGITASRLYAPPLEAVIQAALRDEMGPQLVGLDGRDLRR
ncbi:MAG TPA: hypothetical protein VFE72_02960 [Lysobacter sp.]|nr:hypothetical protein [Lysobacter sp.]